MRERKREERVLVEFGLRMHREREEHLRTLSRRLARVGRQQSLRRARKWEAVVAVALVTDGGRSGDQRSTLMARLAAAAAASIEQWTVVASHRGRHYAVGAAAVALMEYSHWLTGGGHCLLPPRKVRPSDRQSSIRVSTCPL